VKRLILALLVFSASAPTVFGQAAEQEEMPLFPVRVEIIRGTERTYENVVIPAAEQTDLQRIWSGWLQKVEGAEKDYKHRNGRFGSLDDLRKAHLLGSLLFEPCSSAASGGEAKANFVPKDKLIQVKVSEDGQQFDAVIVDGAGHCHRPPQYPVSLQPIYWDPPPTEKPIWPSTPSWLR
jgi:hypothetical protein